MDEAKYRKQVRGSVEERLGARGRSVRDRAEMVGRWRADFDESLIRRRTKPSFIYTFRDDGSALVEGPGGKDRSHGRWRLNKNGSFSLILEIEPDPEYGIEPGTTEEFRYHLM